MEVKHLLAMCLLACLLVKHVVKEIVASPLLVCIIKQLSGGRMQYLRARRGGALDDAAA